MRCPACGAAPGEDGACARCGRRYQRRGHNLEWDGAETVPGPALLRRLGALVDPLRSPLLPFRYLTALRLEGYYRRTSTDRTLAEEWGAHYLRGLAFDPGAIALDFGCGRGRHIGILTQLGFRVAGQDVRPHPWWAQFSDAGFQTGSNGDPRLPWADGAFDLVLEMEVLHYLEPAAAARHLSEVARVLKPGGALVVLEANDRGTGAAYVRRQLPRLHSLDAVQAWVAGAGLQQVDSWYEGYYASRLPALVAYTRKQLSPRRFDPADFRSRIASRMEPSRRALWCLRAVKPAATGS